MVDWKEEEIEAYLKGERIKKGIEQDRTSDGGLSQLKTKLDAIKQQIRVEESGYNIRIDNVNAQLQHIKDELIDEWDIQDTTFKCTAGNVTIKTTRSLVVTSNSGLIQRLTAIFEDMTKACDCIRSFNIGAIRKYMDADLINERIAHYDKKRNVIISAPKKESGRNEE
jgi:hypothetical protein